MIANVNLLSRIGWTLLAAGVLLFVVLSFQNRRAVWIPVAADLPRGAGESVVLEFVPREDGFYEIQIEANDEIGDTDRERYLLATERPSALDLRWTVFDGEERVASGGARDYLYVERGPGNLLGRLRRILLRIPYSQDERHWRTLGFAGSTTSCRGVGRFGADAGTRYTLHVRVDGSHPELMDDEPKVVVRPERLAWGRHAATARPMGYSALLAFGAGAAMLAGGCSLRRVER